MIDWTRITELRDEIGAEDFDEVVELFLSEVEERLETLSPQKPIVDQEDDMHFLKGSALNLGFDKLASLCHDCEKRTSAGETMTCFESIVATYEASKTAFISKFNSGEMDQA